MEGLKLALGLVLVLAGIAGLVLTSRRHVNARTDSRDVARWVSSIAGLMIGLWLFASGLVYLMREHLHGS